MIPLVLASQSASRREMLTAAGVPFTALPAEVDERAIEAEMGSAPPAEVALALARAKALAVSRAVPDAWVLGSDSLVTVEGRRFDKPASREEAARHHDGDVALALEGDRTAHRLPREPELARHPRGDGPGAEVLMAAPPGARPAALVPSADREDPWAASAGLRSGLHAVQPAPPQSARGWTRSPMRASSAFAACVPESAASGRPPPGWAPPEAR